MGKDIFCVFVVGIKDMANLNFQQPPRSITSQTLSRNAFTSSSLSGHVTPTSGMFPGSTNSFTPQQLSPSRNLQPMGSRSLFNQQRSFSERRPVQSVGSVIQDWWVCTRYQVSLRVHFVYYVVELITSDIDRCVFYWFIIIVDLFAGMPIQLAVWVWGRTDHRMVLKILSIVCNLCSAVLIATVWLIVVTIHLLYLIYLNFHRLPVEGRMIRCHKRTLRCQENSLMVSHSLILNETLRSCWRIRVDWPFLCTVGMVKAPTSESTEFTMSNEDFPALPGTQPTIVSENSSTTPSASVSGSSSSLSSDNKLTNHDSNSQSEQVLSSNNRIGNVSAAPGAEKHQQQLLQQQQHGLHQNKKGIQTFPEGIFCIVAFLDVFTRR